MIPRYHININVAGMIGYPIIEKEYDGEYVKVADLIPIIRDIARGYEYYKNETCLDEAELALALLETLLPQGG